ncbi:MAG: hypothetical protein ACKN9T_10055 [Candidatus Methylumidiphilus sp.]
MKNETVSNFIGLKLRTFADVNNPKITDYGGNIAVDLKSIAMPTKHCKWCAMQTRFLVTPTSSVKKSTNEHEHREKTRIFIISTYAIRPKYESS